jgi:hypothetical protein
MDYRLALIKKKNDGNLPLAFSCSPDLAPVVWQKTEQIYNKKTTLHNSFQDLKEPLSSKEKPPQLFKTISIFFFLGASVVDLEGAKFNGLLDLNFWNVRDKPVFPLHLYKYLFVNV